MRTFLTCLSLIIPMSANAATFFSDASSWNAAMSSTTSIQLPASQAGDFSVGGVSFLRDGAATQLLTGGLPDTWSTVIDGIDLAISAPEDFKVQFANPVTGFSFAMHEPSTFTGAASIVNSCNAVCFDSEFKFELSAAGTVIDSFQFMPVDDIRNFVGFSSATAFDTLVVTDLTGTIDNEFFGEFKVGSIAPVPLPAGMWLMLGGLGAFAMPSAPPNKALGLKLNPTWLT